MKRRICVIITCMLLLCVGCGSLEEDSCVKDSFASYEKESSAGEQDFESGTQEQEKKDPAVYSGRQDSMEFFLQTEEVSVHTEHVFEEYVDRESGQLLVGMNYQVVSLEEGNETLQHTISLWMEKRQQDLEEDGLALMIKTKAKQKEMNNSNLNASIWHEITIYRADNRVVSLLDRQYSYCVDDWNNNYTCVNFDVESGTILTLDGLLVDKSGFWQFIEQYCKEQVGQTYTNRETDDVFVDKIYENILEGKNWCLDASGLVFVYEDDALEYSNEGVVYIHVPYQDVSAFMDTKYLWSAAYGTAALSCGETGTILVDGVEKQIRLEKHYNEYYIEQVELLYEDVRIEMGSYMSTDSIYLIRHRDWQYLLVSVDMASNDYETYLYQLQEDSIGEIYFLTGKIDPANVSSEKLVLELRVDVLGTYTTYAEYAIQESGGVAVRQSEFTISHFSHKYSDLVTTRQLPVDQDGTHTYLPIGSVIRILKTDNRSWAALLVLDTQEEVTLWFEREEDYTISIEGVGEEDYFESLPYAG